MQISIILLGKLINFFIMILDTLQHNALRKATPGMEKDNIQYKCISHNSRSPAIFLQDKTASRHPCPDK